MKFLILNWRDVYNLTLQLSERIVDSGFKPNVIVGIARGGWIPARILSDVLYTKNMSNVRIEYYSDLGVKGKEPKIIQPLSVDDMRGKSVLVVDEIADSGETLAHAIEHIKEQGAKELKTSVLHLKPGSCIRPDFFVQEVDTWTVYPWEIRESIINLVRLFREEDPSADMKAIRNRLVFEVGFEPTVADYFIKRL